MWRPREEGKYCPIWSSVASEAVECFCAAFENFDFSHIFWKNCVTHTHLPFLLSSWHYYDVNSLKWRIAKVIIIIIRRRRTTTRATTAGNRRTILKKLVKMVSMWRKQYDFNVNNRSRKLLMNVYMFFIIIIMHLNINHVFSSPSSTSLNIDSIYNHHRASSSSSPYPNFNINNPRINFENAYKGAIIDVRSKFIKQHFDFDAFFRHVLKSAHSDFHRMFSDTYGILYDRHSFIFNNMFHNLEQYYNDGNIDLTEAMKEFFSLLYKKMFEELNAQYAFDSKYLNCTVKHMEEMKPFGELPQKLTTQVRRTFVAIRTFVQALKYGNDILKTVMELPVTSSCENVLRSISYCPRCERTNNNNLHRSIPICRTSCINSIEKSCLPFSSNLDREWNKYLNDMVRLAGRLKTSFNIEHIVGPIHIQISDAIMNFQENGLEISQRLFNKCGKPIHTKRNKRSEYSTNNKNGGGDFEFQRMPTLNKPRIETIIDAITIDFKAMKYFWSHLPQRLCSHLSTNEKCLSNDTFRSMGEDLDYRDKNNFEIINQQIATLRLISINLNNAYNGLNVDFENNLGKEKINPPIDDEETDGSGDFSEASGSGFIEQISQNPIYQHNSSSNDDILIVKTTTVNPIDSGTTKIITLVSSTPSGCYKQPPSKMLALYWILCVVSLLYFFH